MSLTLEQTLASILQSLANFFGVTTQTIMENAPMWLAKYGWYVTVKDLGFNIFVGVFIGAIISSIIWFILYLMIEVDFKKWHLHHSYIRAHIFSHYYSLCSNYYLHYCARIRRN